MPPQFMCLGAKPVCLLFAMQQSNCPEPYNCPMVLFRDFMNTVKFLHFFCEFLSNIKLNDVSCIMVYEFLFLFF